MKVTHEIRALKKAFSVGSVLLPSFTAEKAFRLFVHPRRHDRPDWEKENLAQARTFRLKNGLAAYSWGSGPKVLLVHGWDGRGTQMSRIAMALASRGFEAIAIDLPAHGDSAGKITHVLEASAAIRSSAEELGPLRAVIAHSFGSGASVHALYQGMDCEKLIGLASPNRFTGVLDRFCDYFEVKGRGRDRLYDQVIRYVGIDPYEHYPSAWAKKIDQPALFIHDPNDGEVPCSDSFEIHSEWKNSQFVRLTGVGHRRILKSEETIGKIYDFLK